jgi:hypothetical protein
MMAFNSSYKAWHRPNQIMKSEGGTARTHQGYYKVQHPEKYVGDPALIIYRSGWEHSFCRWCDFSPSIIKWSSEPTKIPFYDRVSNLDECRKSGLDPNNPKNWVIKNYNVDFWIELDKGEGISERIFVEIKPSNKLKKPIPPKENSSLKEQRKFNSDAKEYLINEAKWAAMNAWAQKNGAKFYVMTEDVLSKLLGRFWSGNV